MADARSHFRLWMVGAIVLLTAGASTAQRVALLTPNKSSMDQSIATHLKAAFSDSFRVQDLEMSRTAFDASGRSANAFNMSLIEARDLASLIGCDFLILIRSGTQRRAELERPDYFESFAAYYVVSGRSGRLIKWSLVSEKGDNEMEAQRRLLQSIDPDLTMPIKDAWKSEPVEVIPVRFDEVPEEGTPEAKGFRPPVPYRKMKPEYTRTAYLYDITATVEATVDLDERGQISRAEISRWAGFGLDESVVAAIRAMSWRPAERGGKPLPSRFLLRYNFRKVEKDN
jgi:hypothetical protein